MFGDKIFRLTGIGDEVVELSIAPVEIDEILPVPRHGSEVGIILIGKAMPESGSVGWATEKQRGFAPACRIPQNRTVHGRE